MAQEKRAASPVINFTGVTPMSALITKIKNLLALIQSWSKNVIGETISSKKTLYTFAAIYVLSKLALNTIDKHPVVASVTIVVSGICFVGWLYAQTQIDKQKINMGKKD